LHTIDYLQRYQGIYYSKDSIYRFLDELQSTLKEQVEQISFNHTKKVLGKNIGVIFYDMTTLYFEASSEDDIRKIGFSKDGKHQNPQILLGLLVGTEGLPIGYDLFEGNTYEGHTLVPVLKKFEEKFNLSKPIVIADSGLLSKENIEQLEENAYEYIIGARIKNESDKIKQKILSTEWKEGKTINITRNKKQRLIVSYSNKRAKKDAYNRERGLRRLEKSLRRGKLNKSHINNRGYNKYLRLEGDVIVQIDYEKFEKDQLWDGLKGYITNTKLSRKKIIENYNHLWQIEKAFRISKTDLKIRPIYHRIIDRIEAHICIAFTAYSIYKELERTLYKFRAPFSVKRAAELTQNMYQISVILPESKKTKDILLKMDQEQALLTEIIRSSF
jgi:transposase